MTAAEVLAMLAAHPGTDARTLAVLLGMNAADPAEVRKVRSVLSRARDAGKVTRSLKPDSDGGPGLYVWTVAPA